MMPKTKWLLISLFTLGSIPAMAQTIAPGEFVFVEERTKQPNGQITLSYSIAPATDTLPVPVRWDRHNRKRAVSTEPAWPDAYPSRSEGAAEPIMTPVFYIMSIRPGSSAYDPVYWYRKRP